MTTKTPSVLIVDDERVVCDLLHDELSERGYLCTAVLNGNDALSKLSTEDFDVVMLDIRLSGMSGMDVLREMWLNHKNTAVIMITAINDTATAVSAMQLGAADYIVKPFDLDRVHNSICAALWTQQATAKSSDQMDAIASGVEAQLDPYAGYTSVVTQRTIDIARQLSIAEEEIQRWTTAKVTLASKRKRAAKSSLGKPK